MHPGDGKSHASGPGAVLVKDVTSSAWRQAGEERRTPAVKLELQYHFEVRRTAERLLVSQAELRGTPLLTKDRHLRDHFPRAVWK